MPWLEVEAPLLSLAMKFLRPLGCLMLAIVLTAACGSSDEAAGTSPFDAVLIDLFGTDDTDAYLADTDQRASELVMACMNEAGFEFVIDPATEPPEQREAMDLEAATADGFGIISDFRSQFDGFDPRVPLAPDPNAVYLSGLSRTEADRFIFTLEGPEAEPGQRQEGGCYGQASDEAYANWLRFSSALPNFTVLGEERDTHPDWLAARAEWQTCMLDRGLDYSEPDAIRTDVISLMRETVNEKYPGSQLPLIEVDGVFQLDPEVDVLLDELAAFERDAAVANVECTEPLAEKFDDVERLVQQEFVDRNQETIDALLAASVDATR